MSDYTFKLAEDSALGKAGQHVTLDMKSGQVRLDGKRIELALAPSDVTYPAEIPTYLAGYSNGTFRADEISPPILVDKSSGKYRSFDSDDAFRAVNVKASLQQAVPEVDPKSALADYVVVERLAGSFVADITDENAKGTLYKPRQAAARRISRALYLDREIDVATLVTTTGSWAANNVAAVAAGAKWNGGATSDPIADIQGRMEASDSEVTDIWFNRKVANAFLRHPSTRDQMRQMLGDRGADDVAKSVLNGKPGSTIDFMIPGFPPFHVVTAKVKNETTLAKDYVYGNHCVLTVKPSGVPEDGEEIATTYTFRRRGAQGVGFETREFRVEGRGNGGVMVVASMGDIAKMTGSSVGGLLTSCWQ